MSKARSVKRAEKFNPAVSNDITFDPQPDGGLHVHIVLRCQEGGFDLNSRYPYFEVRYTMELSLEEARLLIEPLARRLKLPLQSPTTQSTTITRDAQEGVKDAL